MEAATQNGFVLSAWPSKGLLPAVIFFLICLTGFLLWNRSEEKRASVALTEPLLITPSQQHLGKLLQHEKREFSFTIKNQGKEPLRIIKVEHFCGCTESGVDKEVLAPGETTRITGSLNAESRVGEFGSQILVSYQKDSQRDDGDQAVAQAKVLVGAKAVTLINLPDHLDLGSTVLGQEPKPITFEVMKGEADVDWDELKIEAGKVKSEVRSVAKGKWRVIVRAPISDGIESFREGLNLKLVNSGKPEAVVQRKILQLTWKTESEHFWISPQVIYLRGDRVAKVKIKSLKSRSVEISRFIIPPDAAVQIKQVKENGQLYLQFQNFPPKDNLKHQIPWSGKIQLVLRDGFVEEKCQVGLIQ